MKSVIGKICPRHKELGGMRYSPNRLCVECAKKSNRDRNAARPLTVSAEIKELKREIRTLKNEKNELLAEISALRGSDD